MRRCCFVSIPIGALSTIWYLVYIWHCIELPAAVTVPRMHGIAVRSCNAKAACSSVPSSGDVGFGEMCADARQEFRWRCYEDPQATLRVNPMHSSSSVRGKAPRTSSARWRFVLIPSVNSLA